jgi:hypothetical protein
MAAYLQLEIDLAEQLTRRVYALQNYRYVLRKVLYASKSKQSRKKGTDCMLNDQETFFI